MAPTTGVGVPLGKASRAGQDITDKVGPTLRARREQLGWSLEDVAAWLRIRLSYLQALEEGSTRDMPGDAYVLGFLRSYAGALGFDAEDMVARFRREMGGLARKPELTFPVPAPDRSLPAGVLILLGVVVIVAAYAAWYRYGDHTHVQPQRVPPMTESMPGVTGQSTTSPQLATVMPLPGHAPSGAPRQAPASAASVVAAPAAAPQGAPMQADPTQAQPQQSTPAPQGDDFSGGATPPETPAPSPAAQGPATQVPAAAPFATTTPATPAPAASLPAPVQDTAAPDQIALHASAATWVQVKGADGHVIYDHVMQPGDVWPAPAQGGPFTLTVGNAGGLALSVGATTSPVLGRVGAVRRGIALDPATIRDGSVAVAPVIPRPARPVAPAPSPTPVATPAAAPAAPQPAAPSPGQGE